MTYQGEQLIYGYAGNLLIYLSFTAALGSALLYFFASDKNEIKWRKSARIIFLVQFLSTACIILLLLFLLVNHRFEYYYVWQHSNSETPLHYIVSSLWEGQEGSFLMWMFWNGMLGIFLVKTAQKWEPVTMVTVSLVQVFIASMLLGIDFFGYKIGSNPFILLRDHPDMANMPFAKVPDYLSKIDGRGLNPLLQNYWMLIHPPVLFLGFALTLIPFAYAVAGLWIKEYDTWQKPALPWIFSGVAVLGAGVLMGGAWAYEALSFGGFWAWDPVENSSLVPWLTLVAGGHSLLINIHSRQSYRTSFALLIITFVLVLYSTFLTRSGILGDTSVHAFTDLGMSGQLLVYLLFFAIAGFALLLKNWKQIPSHRQNEHLLSREFWMFTGALVLCISSFQIIFTTSIPVINKIFGAGLAPPVNPAAHYNTWQVPFAVIIALFSGAGLFLKFRNTDRKLFLKDILLPVIVALILSLAIILGLSIKRPDLIVLLFTSLFSIGANTKYIFRVLGGGWMKAGKGLAHTGFAMILAGALISTHKSVVISQNSSGIDVTALGKEFSNRENILLMVGDTLRMHAWPAVPAGRQVGRGEYLVSYRGKELHGKNVLFRIDFMKPGEKDGDTALHLFSLFPRVQLNPKMGNVAEPDTRHFLTNDVYTFVNFADLDTDKNDSVKISEHTISIGDTILLSNSMIIPVNLYRLPVNDSLILMAGLSPDSLELAVKAELEIIRMKKKSGYIYPVFIISKNNFISFIDDEDKETGISVSFVRIFPEMGKIHLRITERKNESRDFIIMKAIVFPYINILWAGAVAMVLGTVISVIKRIKK
ncbi:MAG: cytochrome c biogenesis protein CcsA [Bacteroidetes bacterium]|nr:cytochrome c biogenesis protein CcsA [Bacteroidota bacterium]